MGQLLLLLFLQHQKGCSAGGWIGVGGKSGLALLMVCTYAIHHRIALKVFTSSVFCATRLVY